MTTLIRVCYQLLRRLPIATRTTNNDMPFTTDFDERLSEIDHYRLYPELYPWIGKHYRSQDTKILAIGESHTQPPHFLRYSTFCDQILCFFVVDLLGKPQKVAASCGLPKKTILSWLTQSIRRPAGGTGK